MTDKLLDEALAPEPSEEAPATETPQEQPEEAAPETPEEAPTSGAERGEVTVPLAALHAERDARQKLAAEVEAIKAAAQPKEEQKAAPDPYADPEGFAKWQQDQTQQQIAQVQMQFRSDLLNLSKASASRVHGADKAQEAEDWVKEQPQHVQQQILSQADPYEAAIQEKAKAEVAEQVKGLDQNTLAQFLEWQKNGGQTPAPAPTVPVSTVKAQSVGARRGPEWTGPTSLDDIIPD